MIPYASKDRNQNEQNYKVFQNKASRNQDVEHDLRDKFKINKA